MSFRLSSLDIIDYCLNHQDETPKDIWIRFFEDLYVTDRPLKTEDYSLLSIVTALCLCKESKQKKFPRFSKLNKFRRFPKLNKTLSRQFIGLVVYEKCIGKTQMIDSENTDKASILLQKVFASKRHFLFSDENFTPSGNSIFDLTESSGKSFRETNHERISPNMDSGDEYINPNIEEELCDIPSIISDEESNDTIIVLDDESTIKGTLSFEFADKKRIVLDDESINNRIPNADTEENIQKIIERLKNGVTPTRGIRIEIKSIRALSGKGFLNDSIIGFFLDRIVERNRKVFAFHTGFKLDRDYSLLKNYTKKLKPLTLFDMDVLLFPTHVQPMHWTLIVVFMNKKEITYFDSYKSYNHALVKDSLQGVRRYLEAESNDKKTPINFSEWKIGFAKKRPTQENGYDCGVFVCMYAEYASKNMKFDFSQQDVTEKRKTILFDIYEHFLNQQS